MYFNWARRSLHVLRERPLSFLFFRRYFAAGCARLATDHYSFANQQSEAILTSPAPDLYLIFRQT
jgi:hypothetical protein